MKLLLTSDGLSSSALKVAFRKFLPNPINTCKVLLMSCPETKEDYRYAEDVKKELKLFGIELQADAKAASWGFSKTKKIEQWMKKYGEREKC